ncbi:MAG TPA: TonB-dependent receptor [Steroidobacter sp.]
MLKGLTLKSRLIAFTWSASICALAVAEPPKPIDMPPGELGAALELISKQAGVELAFRPEQVAGLYTRGVKGTLSAQEAVSKLLEGTPLHVQADEATGAMMVGREPPPTASSEAAPQAPAESEASDGRDEQEKTSGTGRADGFWSRFRLAQAESSATSDSLPDARGNLEKIYRNNPLALEEVVVTGTHIRGVDNPTVPLIVLDREFIDSTGLTTTVQLIESLPQNFALVNQTITGGALSDNSFSTIQGSTINLRGIGEGTTLTLVNGRRMALGYDGTAVNIAALPLSVMERVEVLTDGASALYGSDAVGGVVNFVFRKDFDGAESRISYGDADGTDDFRISQVYGRSWGSGNFVVSGEYYKRDMLLASDRDYTTVAGDNVPSLLPEDKNTAVTLFGRQSLTENVEVFLDALFTNRDSYNRSMELSVTSDPHVYVDNTQLSLNAGVGWKLGESWRAEVSAGYAEDDLEVDIVDLPSPIRQYAATPILAKFTGFDAKVDGPVFQLPGGTVRLALGAHRREESHDYKQLGFDINHNPIPGYGSSFSAERTVSSVFAEASVPLIGASNARRLAQRLDLSVAARYDDYSDFGSSLDPRIGLSWVPTPGVKLRGSWGTSYLAPKLKHFDVAFNTAVAVENFFLANGLTVMQLSGNAPELLKAQESKNYTFGIDLSPAALPGFKLSANYYEIDYRDKIEELATLPLQRMLSNPEDFPGIVIFDPTMAQIQEAIRQGELGRPFMGLNPDFTPNPNFDLSTVQVLFDLRTRNIGVLKQTGFDLSTSYTFNAGGAQMRLGFDIAYIDDIVKRLTASSPALSVLDTYANPTHTRARFNFQYARGGWTFNSFVHRRNSYIDNRLNEIVGIDSHVTVDVNLTYRFGEGEGALANTTLSLSSINVLDEDPPRAAVRGPGYYDLGFDSTNASPLGRVVTLDLSKRW